VYRQQADEMVTVDRNPWGASLTDAQRQELRDRWELYCGDLVMMRPGADPGRPCPCARRARCDECAADFVGIPWHVVGTRACLCPLCCVQTGYADQIAAKLRDDVTQAQIDRAVKDLSPAARRFFESGISGVLRPAEALA